MNDTLTKIRTKYPQYQDIPDQELAQKIVSKYPQYGDLLGDVSAPVRQFPEVEPLTLFQPAPVENKAASTQLHAKRGEAAQAKAAQLAQEDPTVDWKGDPITDERQIQRNAQRKVTAMSEIPKDIKDKYLGMDLYWTNQVQPEELDAQLKEAVDRIKEHGDPEKGYWMERVPFLGGVYSAGDLLQVKSSADDLFSGKGSPEDLEAVAQFIAKTEAHSEKGFWEGTGDLVTAMPGYMVEFMATGGAYSGAKAGTQKALKGTAEKSLKNAVINSVARVAGVAAQAAANPQMVARATSQRMAKQSMENLMQLKSIPVDERPIYRDLLTENDEGFGESLVRGFLDAGIELGSERSGEVLDKFAGPLKGAILRKFMEKYPGTSAAQFLQVLRKAGWNGPFNEIMEEEVGKAARGLVGNEDYKVSTPTELLQQAIAFSVPGVVGSSLNIPESMRQTEKGMLLRAQMEEAAANQPLTREMAMLALKSDPDVAENPGQYILFHDPKTGQSKTVSLVEGTDPKAALRVHMEQNPEDRFLGAYNVSSVEGKPVVHTRKGEADADHYHTPEAALEAAAALAEAGMKEDAESLLAAAEEAEQGPTQLLPVLEEDISETMDPVLIGKSRVRAEDLRSLFGTETVEETEDGYSVQLDGQDVAIQFTNEFNETPEVLLESILADHAGEEVQGVMIPQTKTEFNRLDQQSQEAILRSYKPAASFARASVNGEEVPNSYVIKLAGAQPLGKVRHEIIHWLRDSGLMTEQEWNSLKSQFARPNDSESMAEERVGYAYERFVKNPYDQTTMGRIHNFFRKLFHVHSDPAYNSLRMIEERSFAGLPPSKTQGSDGQERMSVTPEAVVYDNETGEILAIASREKVQRLGRHHARLFPTFRKDIEAGHAGWGSVNPDGTVYHASWWDGHKGEKWEKTVSEQLRKDYQFPESGTAPERFSIAPTRNMATESPVREMSNGAVTEGPGLVKWSVTAYHGTPHKVDKFRSDRIGSGEGAQVYGWGLYFAENQEVSRSYAQKLSGDVWRLRYDDGTWFGSSYSTKQEALRDLRELFPGREDVHVEHVNPYATHYKYQVELNVSGFDLLDWDLPLYESEAGRKLQRILNKVIPESTQDEYDMRVGNWDEMRGQEAYRLIVRESAEGLPGQGDPSGDLQKDASMWLLEQGIPGIRYLDGGSRARGEGTYNYVIFDEADIKITHENDQPVTATEAFSVSPISPESEDLFATITNAPIRQPAERDKARHQKKLQDFVYRHVAPRSKKLIYFAGKSTSTAHDLLLLDEAYQQKALGEEAGKLKRRLDEAFKATSTGGIWRGKYKKHMEDFLDQAGPVMAYLNAVGHDDNGYVFRDFDARVGVISMKDFNKKGHKVGDQIIIEEAVESLDRDGNTVEVTIPREVTIGDMVKLSDGKAAYQLLQRVDKKTQEELYTRFTELFPEGQWLVDEWIDPRLRGMRTTRGGVEIPTFNRFTLAEAYKVTDPYFQDIPGYTPDVVATRMMFSAFKGLFSPAAHVKSPGRKYKTGSARAGRVQAVQSKDPATGETITTYARLPRHDLKDIIDGWQTRSFQVLREKARKRWMEYLLKNAYVDEKNIPMEERGSADWVALPNAIGDIMKAIQVLKWYESGEDAEGNKEFPELESRFSKIADPAGYSRMIGELSKMGGAQNKFIRKEIVEALTRTIENQWMQDKATGVMGAALKVFKGGVRQSKQLLLAMPSTWMVNVTSNDLFTFEAAFHRAVKGILEMDKSDLRTARNLLVSQGAYRWHGWFGMMEDYTKFVDEFFPAEVFEGASMVQDLEIPLHESIGTHLKKGALGAATLGAMGYGNIDIRAKQRYAYANLKAIAETKAADKGLTGQEKQDAIKAYMSNPPKEDRVAAIQQANVEYLNYNDSPDILNKLIAVPGSALVMPFPRFAYAYLSKQASRGFNGAKLLIGKVPKGQRAEAMADLLSFAAFGMGGVGAALALALGIGEDDEDMREYFGTDFIRYTDPVSGELKRKQLSRELITTNRANLTGLFRKLGLDSDDDTDFWVRVRNWPQIAMAGNAAIAFQTLKDHGPVYAAADYLHQVKDLATDFFSMGAAVKVPDKAKQELTRVATGETKPMFTDPYGTYVPFQFYVTDQLSTGLIPGRRQAEALRQMIDPTVRKRTRSKQLDYNPGAFVAMKQNHISGLVYAAMKRATDSEIDLMPHGSVKTVAKDYRKGEKPKVSQHRREANKKIREGKPEARLYLDHRGASRLALIPDETIRELPRDLQMIKHAGLNLRPYNREEYMEALYPPQPTEYNGRLFNSPRYTGQR